MAPDISDPNIIPWIDVDAVHPMSQIHRHGFLAHQIITNGFLLNVCTDFAIKESVRETLI